MIWLQHNVSVRQFLDMNMWIIIKCIIGTKGGNLGLKHEGNKKEVVNLLNMWLLDGMKENYEVMFKMMCNEKN